MWNVSRLNHDISWMGAATGNLACICTVLRIAIRYNGFDVLEDGYGINLRQYPCLRREFIRMIRVSASCRRSWMKKYHDAVDPVLAKMHKAITVIQFKLEGQIDRNAIRITQINDRIHLEHINFAKGTVKIHAKGLQDAGYELPDDRSEGSVKTHERKSRS